MKPRYRILWDAKNPSFPDFWEVGTDNFFYFTNRKRHIWFNLDLRQRVGLNN